MICPRLEQDETVCFCLLLTAGSIRLEVLARATRQEKERKDTYIGKEEIKLPVSSNVLTLSRENPDKYTHTHKNTRANK